MRISKHTIVTSKMIISFYSRSGRDWMKEYALTWGDLPIHELKQEKSAEAGLGSRYELSLNRQRSHEELKGRTLSCSKCCKEAYANRHI